jgi:hypothetical protein
MTILSDKVRTARHKTRRCDQCGSRINLGERYREQVHTYDDFVVYRAHEDCDRAAALRTSNADEPCNLLTDIDTEDFPWLLAEFPAVTARLGITDRTISA